MEIFETGVRPIIDAHLTELAENKNYPNYWRASSAGYCLRKNIFERLEVPHVMIDPRKQKIFTVGHIFHEWIQRLTKPVSIAQEAEIRDEELDVVGHFDDLLKIDDRLVLYDYKTQHSRAFHYAKDRPLSRYHRLQLGTYLYMLRKQYPDLREGRILKISKDDLSMTEEPLFWNEDLESDVREYWEELQEAWKEYNESGELPGCTCHVYENGFMANPKYNPYYFNEAPCSLDWFKLYMDAKERKDKEG